MKSNLKAADDEVRRVRSELTFAVPDELDDYLKKLQSLPLTYEQLRKFDLRMVLKGIKNDFHTPDVAKQRSKDLLMRYDCPKKLSDYPRNAPDHRKAAISSSATTQCAPSKRVLPERKRFQQTLSFSSTCSVSIAPTKARSRFPQKASLLHRKAKQAQESNDEPLMPDDVMSSTADNSAGAPNKPANAKTKNFENDKKTILESLSSIDTADMLKFFEELNDSIQPPIPALPPWNRRVTKPAEPNRSVPTEPGRIPSRMTSEKQKTILAPSLNTHTTQKPQLYRSSRSPLANIAEPQADTSTGSIGDLLVRSEIDGNISRRILDLQDSIFSTEQVEPANTVHQTQNKTATYNLVSQAYGQKNYQQGQHLPETNLMNSSGFERPRHEIPRHADSNARIRQRTCLVRTTLRAPLHSNKAATISRLDLQSRNEKQCKTSTADTMVVTRPTLRSSPCRSVAHKNAQYPNKLLNNRTPNDPEQITISVGPAVPHDHRNRSKGLKTDCSISKKQNPLSTKGFSIPLSPDRMSIKNEKPTSDQNGNPQYTATKPKRKQSETLDPRSSIKCGINLQSTDTKRQVSSLYDTFVKGNGTSARTSMVGSSATTPYTSPMPVVGVIQNTGDVLKTSVSDEVSMSSTLYTAPLQKIPKAKLTLEFRSALRNIRREKAKEFVQNHTEQISLNEEIISKEHCKDKHKSKETTESESERTSAQNKRTTKEYDERAEDFRNYKFIKKQMLAESGNNDETKVDMTYHGGDKNIQHRTSANSGQSSPSDRFVREDPVRHENKRTRTARRSDEKPHRQSSISSDDADRGQTKRRYKTEGSDRTRRDREEIRIRDRRSGRDYRSTSNDEERARKRTRDRRSRSGETHRRRSSVSSNERQVVVITRYYNEFGYTYDKSSGYQSRKYQLRDRHDYDGWRRDERECRDRRPPNCREHLPAHSRSREKERRSNPERHRSHTDHREDRHHVTRDDQKATRPKVQDENLKTGPTKNVCFCCHNQTFYHHDTTVRIKQADDKQLEDKNGQIQNAKARLVPELEEDEIDDQETCDIRDGGIISASSGHIQQSCTEDQEESYTSDTESSSESSDNEELDAADVAINESLVDGSEKKSADPVNSTSKTDIMNNEDKGGSQDIDSENEGDSPGKEHECWSDDAIPRQAEYCEAKEELTEDTSHEFNCYENDYECEQYDGPYYNVDSDDSDASSQKSDYERENSDSETEQRHAPALDEHDELGTSGTVGEPWDQNQGDEDRELEMQRKERQETDDAVRSIEAALNAFANEVDEY